MKKQKAVGRSKTKDSSLEVEAVQSIESDINAAEAIEPQPVQIEQDNPLIPEKEATESAPQMSRNQKYWIATLLIFADCSVQSGPDGIFDVLARNFGDPGQVSWWLWRIGHQDKAKYLKGKDIVDGIRKVAAELHKDLIQEIGRPVVRL
jgi:hypothetical protein